MYEQFIWRIMMYLSGDNNLSEEMIWALSEMADSAGHGVPDKLMVTIQYDASARAMRTRRFIIVKGNKNADVEPRVGPLKLLRYFVEEVDAENAAAKETLAAFIKWSLEQGQAQYNMLILSGHGSGTVGDFLEDDNTKDKQQRPGSFTIPDLAQALRMGLGLKPDDGERVPQSRIDVLGMDSCLMSMAEVCYQVRNCARFMVGSEGFVPNTGWPYGVLLDKLKARFKTLADADADIELAKAKEPGAKVAVELKTSEQKKAEAEDALRPEPIAAAIVDDYLGFYREYLPAGVSVDIAACDLEQFESTANGNWSPDQLAAKCAEFVPDLERRCVSFMHCLPHKNWRGAANVLATLEAAGLCEANLTQSVKYLARLMRDGVRDHGVQNIIVLAHWRAQAFKFDQYTDLWDFCDQLLREAGASLIQEVGPDSIERCRSQLQECGGLRLTDDEATPEVIAKSCDLLQGSPDGRKWQIMHACYRVQKQIERVVTRHGSEGIDFQHTHGLSVYFPWSRSLGADEATLDGYGKLSFASRSKWKEFVTAYLDWTSREARGETTEHREARFANSKNAPDGWWAADGTPQTPHSNKFSRPLDRFSRPLDRYWLTLVGERFPWGMKNPPQGVFLKQPPGRAAGAPVQRSGAKAVTLPKPNAIGAGTA